MLLLIEMTKENAHITRFVLLFICLSSSLSLSLSLSLSHTLFLSLAHTISLSLCPYFLSFCLSLSLSLLVCPSVPNPYFLSFCLSIPLSLSSSVPIFVFSLYFYHLSSLSHLSYFLSHCLSFHHDFSFSNFTI